ELRFPGRHSFGPEFDRRGFPAYPEPPRLLIDPKRGRPPSDCDWYGGYWIVSDKLKAVLDAVDPDACAFVKCDVRHAQGKATDGGYWLMDIVRNLDAVDESASRRLNIRYDARLARGKSYGLTGLSDVVFKPDVVGSAHLFGLIFALGSIFCDG